MRIISKIKDYYDYVQQYGFDPNVVYDRSCKNIHYKDDNGIYDRMTKAIDEAGVFKNISWIPSTDYLDYHTLFFCGRVYVFWVYTTFTQSKNPYTPNKRSARIIWNIDEVRELYLKTAKWPDLYSQRYFDKFINEVTIDPVKNCIYQDLNYQLFKDVGCPVFLDTILSTDLYSSRGYTLNPLLIDILFHHIVSAQDCYQTLDTFLSSIQTKTDMVEVSNESKILKHGMDKSSFIKTENTSKPRSKK